MRFVCPKEPSHRDGSIEYTQHMFWLKNKENNFQLRALIRGPALSMVSLARKSTNKQSYISVLKLCHEKSTFKHVQTFTRPRLLYLWSGSQYMLIHGSYIATDSPCFTSSDWCTSYFEWPGTFSRCKIICSFPSNNFN